LPSLLVVLQLAAFELLQALSLLVFVFFQHTLPLHRVLENVLDGAAGRFERHQDRAVFDNRRQAVKLVSGATLKFVRR